MWNHNLFAKQAILVFQAEKIPPLEPRVPPCPVHTAVKSPRLFQQEVVLFCGHSHVLSSISL